MKLLIFTTFLMTFPLFGMSTPEKSDGAFTPPETQGTYYSRPAEDSLLGRIIDENAQARRVYESCKEHLEPNSSGRNYLSELESCVWSGKKSANIVGVKDKKDVIEAMKKILPKGISGDGADLNLAEQTLDGAQEKLYNYFREDLEKKIFLDGQDENSTAQRVANHENFNDIFLAQTSRGIAMAVSEYCIEAQDGSYLLSSSSAGRKAQREKNIKGLSGDLANSNSKWVQCAQRIKDVCYVTGPYYEGSSRSKGKKYRVNNESKSRACVITKYIKQARKQLLIGTNIRDQYKDLAKEQQENGRSAILGEPNKIWTGDGSDKNTSVNDLVIRSSEEVIEKSGYSEVSEEQLEEFKKCSEEKDVETCKKFFSLNKDEAEKLVVEFRLRSEVAKSNLEELKTDKEKLIAYLKDQGYSAEKAEELASIDNVGEKGKEGGDGVFDIAQEIIDQYEREKGAIIAEYAEKINRRTSSVQDEFDPEKESKKIEEIADELADRPKRQKDVLLFTNFVTALLSTKLDDPNADPDAPKAPETHYLKPLEVELAAQRGIQADTTDPDAQQRYQNAQDLIQNTESFLEESGIQGSKSDNTSSFGVDKVNEALLPYQTSGEQEEENGNSP